MTLGAFAAERHAAAPLLLGAWPAPTATNRCLLPARTALSSKPCAHRRCG